MSESIVVSERFRSPVIAEKRDGGGVVLRSARHWIALSPEELDRVVAFAGNRAHIQRYPVGS